MYVCMYVCMYLIHSCSLDMDGMWMYTRTIPACCTGTFIMTYCNSTFPLCSLKKVYGPVTITSIEL